MYENALCLELEARSIEFEKQKPVSVSYRGQIVGHFAADLVVENILLIELKALPGLTKQHEAQLMNYLRATGINVGLLLNFGTPKMGIRRIVWQYTETERI